jgi:hypothetical protein
MSLVVFISRWHGCGRWLSGQHNRQKKGGRARERRTKEHVNAPSREHKPVITTCQQDETRRRLENRKSNSNGITAIHQTIPIFKVVLVWKNFPLPFEQLGQIVTCPSSWSSKSKMSTTKSLEEEKICSLHMRGFLLRVNEFISSNFHFN